MSEHVASIIVPTFNRPNELAKCLEAFCVLEAEPFEVIIVDDGSRTPMAPVCEAYEDRLDIRCIRQENQGPAAARNRGAKEAQADILVFTDDDCLPEPGWLTALTACVESAPNTLAGGNSENYYTRNVFSQASQDLVSFLYSYANSLGRGFDFFTSNNMACRRSDFVTLGGFDEEFPLAAGEDRDFGLRWRRRGWPLVFCPDAVVQHAHHMTLRKFIRQQSNYGRGAVHLRRRMAERQEPAVPFEGLKFYAAMAAFPFSTKAPNAPARSLLLGLSQVAMASGFLQEQRKR